MATYTKTTDFLAKDSLPLNNAAKYVKGSEIDAEFDNLTTADADNMKKSVMGTGIETFLQTPSSANLASAITNETGTGSLVFGTSPTLTTPKVVGGSYVYTLTGGSLAADRVLNLPVLTATDTLVTLGLAQTWTAAQTFRAAAAVRSEAASTQDAMVLAGRAGGTSSYAVTLMPTTLTASRTATFPDAATSIPVASYTYTIAGPTAARTVTFPDADFSAGYLNIPQNSQSAGYTLVLGDAGKHILHPSADTTARTFTIPANSSVAFQIGDAVTFINQNGAGVITIAITTDTMRLAGAGTTGSRTLATNGIATAVKLTSTEWIISGTGLT